MTRVLVTGGAGFIGSHVVEQFLERQCDVVVIDDLSAGKPENVDPRATLHQIDIRSAEAARLLRSETFDIFAHLAAHVNVRHSVADPVSDATTNVLGTLNLIEALRTLPPERRPRIVFASTGGALYGGTAPLPTSEVVPAAPESPYGMSKLSAEHYLEYYARIWDLETVALRFGNVYGPRQTPYGEAGVVAIFSKCVALREPLTVFGDGTQTRDYVYVRDIADAFVRAAVCDRLPPLGEFGSRAFNIGTGVSSSVLDIIDRLRHIAQWQPEVRFAPRRTAALSPRYPQSSVSA